MFIHTFLRIPRFTTTFKIEILSCARMRLVRDIPHANFVTEL